MCGRVIQSSGPLRYAIFDGLDVRDSRVHCQSALERAPRSASKRGSDAMLVQLFHSAPINLAWSRSILPRPYIWRRTSLRRVI